MMNRIELIPNLRIYIAGPIMPRGGFTVEENVAQAVKIYWRLINAGVVAFCPYLAAAFPSAFECVEYEDWLRLDEYWIDWATHVYLLPRWKTSSGTLRERAYALETGKCVIIGEDALLAVIGRSL